MPNTRITPITRITRVTSAHRSINRANRVFATFVTITMQLLAPFQPIVCIFESIRIMREILDPTAFVQDLKLWQEENRRFVDWVIDDNSDNRDVIGVDLSEFVSLTKTTGLPRPLESVKLVFETQGTCTMRISGIMFGGESMATYTLVTDEEDESKATVDGMLLDGEPLSADDITNFLRTDPTAAFIHTVMLEYFDFDPL